MDSHKRSSPPRTVPGFSRARRSVNHPDLGVSTAGAAAGQFVAQHLEENS
ncbi:hypothetical protein [Paraburkholderia kururiensis]|nr:hypothetical protein [Paraburkholderia kururiensis]